MQTRVISLPKSVDRRSAISRQLGELGFPFHFFDAIDGVSGPGVEAHYICKPEFPERSYTYRWNAVDGGELACTLSHMVAIRHLWQAGSTRPVLILEDDALFCSSDPALLEGLLAQVPADAAYVQFAATPADTVMQLAEHFMQEKALHMAKTAPFRVAVEGRDLACHCTAGYLITAIGMRSISERWFDGDRVIFPCEVGEVENNVALVADRLVFQAAVSQGGTGYVCTVPIVTTTAIESLLHPNHVPWHQEARDNALKWFETVRPMLAG